ncbi:hypothetical protein HYC85_003802 [Camellia sinensis]|uniref:ABC transporter domain-containing protein n=1 Tax=Camellia sinensis TaxID=4442 RepID=A0A7J7HVY3_CAMSI|nr:hypothetical protein HYC85_003802 [Camellia sinensis]
MDSIQLAESPKTTDEDREHLLAIDLEAAESEVETKFLIRNLTTEAVISESAAAGGGVGGGSRPILKWINAEIPKGVVVGIIGPSGSGKSTLLRALNRLWEPPPHTVYLDGQDICKLDVLSLRRKVGMLFQLPALFEDLDPISFINKNARELSVGQAQRVALARTLANEPEVLLLDEPTSALDPISTQNIEDCMVKLKKSRGMTIVMVSHSIKQIQRIADLVFLLVDGEIVEVLKPNKLSEAKHPMALRFLQLSN